MPVSSHRNKQKTCIHRKDEGSIVFEFQQFPHIRQTEQLEIKATDSDSKPGDELLPRTLKHASRWGQITKPQALHGLSIYVGGSRGSGQVVDGPEKRAIPK